MLLINRNRGNFESIPCRYICMSVNALIYAGVYTDIYVYVYVMCEFHIHVYNYEHVI